MRTLVLLFLGGLIAGGTAFAQSANSGAKSSAPAAPASRVAPASSSPAAPVAPAAALAASAPSNAILPLSGSSYLMDDKHLLSPGDRISFRILEDRFFGEGEAVTNIVVTDSREMDFPLIGRVAVTNKTCKQIAAEVTPLFEKDFYVRATVVLGIDSVNRLRGKAYISGAVRTQGAIDLLFDEPLTAGQAILKAGGFGDFANKKEVKVIRTLSTGEKKTLIINMINVFDKAKTDQDVTLEPGDQIVVSERITVM
jgi:protein involved in polysaccharide export with SLBB domain